MMICVDPCEALFDLRMICVDLWDVLIYIFWTFQSKIQRAQNTTTEYTCTKINDFFIKYKIICEETQQHQHTALLQQKTEILMIVHILNICAQAQEYIVVRLYYQHLPLRVIKWVC